MDVRNITFSVRLTDAVSDHHLVMLHLHGGGDPVALPTLVLWHAVLGLVVTLVLWHPDVTGRCREPPL